jgi:hypothetical protein
MFPRKSRLSLSLCLLLSASVCAWATDAFWNGSTGFWSNAANWDSNNVPNAASENALIFGGLVLVDADFTIGNLTLGGGTVDNDHSLTLTGGASSWSGGILTGSGITQVGVTGFLSLASYASATLSGHTLTNNGTAELNSTSYSFQLTNGATFNNQGQFNAIAASITSGTGSNLFYNSGTFTKSGMMSSAMVSAPFTNAGTVEVASGLLRFSGAYTGQSGSVFHISSGAGAAFEGTLGGTVVTTGSGSLEIYYPLTNNGSLTLDGRTNFNGTLTGSGTSYVGSNGLLSIANFSNATLSGHTLTNNGTAELNSTSYSFQLTNGATFNNQGQFNAIAASITSGTGSNLFFNSGTFTKSGMMSSAMVSAPFTNAGTVEVASGFLRFSGAYTGQSGSVFHISSGAGAAFEGTVGGTVVTTGSGSLEIYYPLTNNGSLTLNGQTNFNGTLTGSGTSYVGSNGILSVASFGSATLSGHTLTNNGTAALDSSSYSFQLTNGATFNNQGQFNAVAASITSGTGSNLFFNSGTFTKSGTISAATVSAPFSNAGTVEVASGLLRFTGAYTGQAGSVFHISSGAGAAFEGAVGGTVVTTGSGSVEIYYPLTNHGSLILDGQTNFNGTLTGSGTTYVGSNGLLNVASYSSATLSGHTLVNNGSAEQNNSNYSFQLTNSARFINQGQFNAGNARITSGTGSNLFFNAGTFTKSDSGSFGMVSAPFTNAGTVGVASGFLDFAGNFTGQPGSVFHISSGAGAAFEGPVSGTVVTTGEGSLQIYYQLINNGTLTFDGRADYYGTLSGSGTTYVGSSGLLSIPTYSNAILSGHTLVNNGTTELNYGFQLADGATFNNQGQFNAGSAYISSGSGSNLVFNAGTFTKSGVFSSAIVAAPFTNAGTVEVAGGFLTFSGAFTGQSGSVFHISNAQGAALDGSVSGTVIITGDGFLEIYYPLINNGSLTLDGRTNYSSTITGSGTTYVGSNGLLITPYYASAALSGHMLVNNGTTELDSTLQLTDGATFNNQGQFNAGAASITSGSGSNLFFNAGTFTKSGSTSSAVISVPFTNAGIIEVESGILEFSGPMSQTSSGELEVTGGAVEFDGSTYVQGGISGSGTIIAPAGVSHGNGTIAPGDSTGTLTVEGSLSLSSSSAFVFELGTMSDLLAVNGNLTLDGTLNVTASAGFAEGQYVLIDYSGALTDNGLAIGSLPAGYYADIVIDSVNTQVRLNVVPEPTVAGLLLAGLPLLARRRRRS